MKELYIAAHEELIEEYFEAHPDATEAEAYEATADAADERMSANLADRIDRARQMHKDGML